MLADHQVPSHRVSYTMSYISVCLSAFLTIILFIFLAFWLWLFCCGRRENIEVNVNVESHYN